MLSTSLAYTQQVELNEGSINKLSLIVPNPYHHGSPIKINLPDYKVERVYDCTDEYFGTSYSKITCYEFTFTDGIKGRMTKTEDTYNLDFVKYNNIQNALISYYISEKKRKQK